MPTTISGTSITTAAIDLTTPLPEVDGGTGSTGAYKMGMATAIASTSGTSIDFTGIPSWAKRITVMFNGVSTNGGSLLRLQAGAGAVVITGYSGSAVAVTAGQTNSGNNGANLSGIDVYVFAAQAAWQYYGAITLSLIGSNVWVASGVVGVANTSGVGLVGINTPNLGGSLDRLRITTVNGTDTFDTGSINIMWEGV